MPAPRPLRDIAVVAFAQTDHLRTTDELSEVEMLMPVLHEVLAQTGLKTSDIGFTCSGSTDYLAGRAFSFTMALDGVGAWPPISESHVEMDGAWALYEAYVRLLLGDIDIALATGSGRSSTADPSLIYPMEMDPFYLAPLGADAMSLAALQARALIDAGQVTQRQMAEIAARCRRDAKDNPHAQVTGDFDVDNLLEADYVRAPLRKHDLPPITDGACAVVIARADRARELREDPVWITGFAHYADAHNPGMRDLRASRSTMLAARAAGVGDARVEVAELQTAFTHEEPLLVEALGLDGTARVNPSGGPLAANPIMATGLVRIAEAARQVRDNGVGRALAHATSGPCLQQNLVCIVEGNR
jgi:acetyl-CoA acetyltransferase